MGRGEEREEEGGWREDQGGREGEGRKQAEKPSKGKKRKEMLGSKAQSEATEAISLQ